MNDCQLGSCKASLESLFSHLTEKDLNRTVTTILLRLAIISAFDLDYYFSQSWGDFVEKSQELWEVNKSPLFDDRLLSWLVSPVSKSLSDKIIKEVSEKVSEAVRISENKLWEVGSIHEGLINSKDKRKSGSHYTPVKLAREVVEEAFRPWLESHKNNPPVDAVLDLKVCDPAVGCGVFLLETTDFLDSYIKDKVIGSKRRIIENCLYGVDIGWFPVEITKVCLWLKAEDSSFNTEHLRNNIQQGDSLVGVSTSEIRDALESVRGSGQKISTAYLKVVGDLLVAAHFNGRSKSDRAAKKKIYLAPTTDCDSADELEEVMAEPLQALRHGEKGIQPLHWPLAFPDVFRRENPGFDVFVGNPPFVGGQLISGSLGDSYFGWITRKYAPAGHYCDLSAYFFRRVFDLCRNEGAMGLIATSTIAVGDSRNGGLLPIREQNGWIYRAISKTRWPGMANVWISIIHISKGNKSIVPSLDSSQCQVITAYLRDKGPDSDPLRLKSLKDDYSKGSQIYGQGFLFDDNDSKASPLHTMNAIAQAERERVFPYIGGSEVLTSPAQESHRWVIFLSDIKDESGLSRFPVITEIVRNKVKPERDALPLTPVNRPLKEKWWAYQAHRPLFYAKIKDLKRIIVASETCANLAFSFLPTGIIYSQKLVCFTYESYAHFGVLQSSAHEAWVLFCGGKRGNGFSYSGSDCFETFPQPQGLPSVDQEIGRVNSFQDLSGIGEEYYSHRANIMVKNQEGLTITYNRFHDPEETSKGILELRRLHSEMDQAVLNAYGWSDVPTACGYGLDYLDTADDAELPEHLQNRIDSGDLFFWDPCEALDFQGQLRASGAVKAKKRLPWRYRWPDAVRDDVLARLLALNAERYEEEVAQGLHPPRKLATITG